MYHRYENPRFETWTKITKSVLLTYRFKSWAHNAWIQYPLSEFEVADNLHVSFWFGWRPVRYHPTSDVGNGNCYWVSCHTGWPNRWIRTGQAMCAGRPYNVPSACTELARPPGAWAKPIIIIIKWHTTHQALDPDKEKQTGKLHDTKLTTHITPHTIIDKLTPLTLSAVWHRQGNIPSL